ncbi:MAG: aminotransferase class I/II-fold pyridoxal phosphate-dependent enzyme [Microbacterium sp.]
MSFDRFEQLTADDLRAQGGLKWTAFPNAIGAFVAESDFGTSPSVHGAIARLLEHDLFGYPTQAQSASVGTSLARFTSDRYGWAIEPGSVGAFPDVLSSLSFVLTHLVPAHSKIALLTPAYMPFLQIIPDHGHEIVEVPLLDGVALDDERIDAAFADGAAMLVLTNPHNPTGVVFSRQELLPLIGIVETHGARIWADEIHAPLIYPPADFTPYAAINEASAAHSITATSASKGWNIPGVKCAQTVFTNDSDLAVWRERGEWIGHTVPPLGMAATAAAYDDGREWIDAFVAHLDGTRRLLADLIAEHLPRARFRTPDGTYLAWLDLREYAASVPELVEGRADAYFRREAGVAGTDGRRCGADYAGFLRLNFATPRAILTETIERMAAALPS